MSTLGIAAATNKHAEASLAKHKRSLTDWAYLPLQHFYDMPIRLAFQGTDILAFRITGTAQKWTMFAISDN
ncbi:hypothetical protein ACH50_22295 [Franconibacter pulveris]|uniref:Uncharacterized protein n=1 Tax=Franconibacter pulveris TaxID=435910 RepID=A0A0J8VH51_9ENTR|nr:hypothetical protein ACH50_22295 [Franconibacter pulveris]